MNTLRYISLGVISVWNWCDDILVKLLQPLLNFPSWKNIFSLISSLAEGGEGGRGRKEGRFQLKANELGEERKKLWVDVVIQRG